MPRKPRKPEPAAREHPNDKFNKLQDFTADRAKAAIDVLDRSRAAGLSAEEAAKCRYDTSRYPSPPPTPMYEKVLDAVLDRVVVPAIGVCLGICAAVVVVGLVCK